jgi:tRNA (cmo5U34)-methyltransferase
MKNILICWTGEEEGKMSGNKNVMSWDSPEAERYEHTIASKIPGYSLLYDLMERLMTAALENCKSANILVAGAGGGQELAVLGTKHPDWSFTGVDPSDTMLRSARKRILQKAYEKRVTLHLGTVDDLPCDPIFYVGTCILVLHFIKDYPDKRKLLKDLSNRLRHGAPLFVVTLSQPADKEAYSLQMQAWKSFMLDHGIPEVEWERFAASIGVTSHLIPASATEELLAEAGFTEVTRFFGAFLIDGWVARKR